MTVNLGCARCGDCCNPVGLDPDNAAKVARARAEIDGGAKFKPGGSPTESLPFILEHWTLLETFDDGAATYACDKFDPDSKACTAHEDRPDVCRDYPWYGREPAEARIFEPRCSFLFQKPPDQRPEGARPLIPLTPRSAT